MSVHEVLMPRVSDTMEAGTVLQWLVAEGEAVTPATPLVEVETDKVTMVIEAGAAGVLAGRWAAEGTALAPGQALATIAPPGVAVERPGPAAPAPAALPVVAVAPVAAAPAARGPGRATPLARALARAHRIDLRALAGSGPDGRVLRQDVEAALRSGGAHAGSEPSAMHAAMARRMTQSKQEVPHYYVDAQVDVTDLVRLRADPDTVAAVGELSLTPFLVRAVAVAVARHPRVNTSWVDGRLVPSGGIHVGVAVALDDDGLVVPVVRHADRSSLRELATTLRDLIDRARARVLRPDEMGGGSITVSNLGGYGVDAFHAIINPPESAILAVGAVRTVPVVRDGGFVARDVVTLSLSADHRVFSGATAALLVGEIRGLLEAPQSLL